MKYVLDTNVILAYLRKHSIWDLIELQLGIFETETDVYIPAVVLGELRSIAVQNKWGINKRRELEIFAKEFIVIDFITEETINSYADIDAFSQGRLEEKSLTGSSRNMGKNDLRIAATASVLNAILITTDKDFQHLHTQFLKVAYFDLNKK
ncbi:type II toxin-antitoxin system VapC family toxin [Dyadobacter diqingensis]|uniref:type II toxin-antitoxin system VapC family toxin n=1 Tax=Dyadobacter diqingensis TaxID=2938121 RepID=UPI0020C19E4D|nr:type II toxin-antitoxin system VapC family toxin [Dyadobacter diqingensis]